MELRIEKKAALRFMTRFVLFFLYTQTIYAQDCKFIRNEYDTVKHYTVKITQDVSIKGGLLSTSICSLRVIQNDTLFFIKTFYTYSWGWSHPVIPKTRRSFFVSPTTV
jgi:hypothetical protein